MAHVLYACELGDGQRQADRAIPILRGLAAAGHRVSIALPDGAPARPRAEQAGLAVVTAPTWRAEPPPGFLAASYADILLASGYATHESLTQLVSEWCDRLRADTPDLVMADFAPTAMLACRVAGPRCVAIGDGYGLPPRRTPLPTMRPWADPLPDIADPEARAIAVINPTLRDLGAEPIGSLSALFAAEPTFLCTFPELDHYEDRGEADYFGEIPRPPEGGAPEWPTGATERFFVSMNPRHLPFRPLLGALRRLGLPTIVEVAGLSLEEAASLAGPSLLVATAPVDRATALAGCDVVAGQTIDLAAPRRPCWRDGHCCCCRRPSSR